MFVAKSRTSVTKASRGIPCDPYLFIYHVYIVIMYLYEGCSNMNASGFIISSHIGYDKMVNVSIKDYMSPLKSHQP